eukprot:458877_1
MMRRMEFPLYRGTSDEFETARLKIPIPTQSRTQPTSVYQTPIASPMARTTPSSIKSQPIESTKNIKMATPTHSEIQFALHLVELILLNVKKLNAKIPSKILKCLNDKKQNKMVIESMLMAPILTHLIRSCISTNKTQQNHHQLLSFFIDYFQQMYPQLIWPKTRHVMETMQTPIKHQMNISCRQSVEIPTPRDTNDDTKFEAFIAKVNAIGNRFDSLETCTNNSKREVCDKLKEIEHKQQELDHKLTRNNTNIVNEWEKSHHNLGKKQQQNIDVLQHQTQKFEDIAQRIQNALKQTEDPKIFESQLAFITQHTTDLERKLDDVHKAIANKANGFKQTVQVALDKYRQMQDVTDLISIGVSPLHTERKEKENDEQQHVDTIREEEKKLSFLNEISESDTGFNYHKKRIQIRNIMNDVVDCKYKIDSFKTTTKCPPSLRVHWEKDTKRMHYIKERDLDKLMRLKRGVARKYREKTTLAPVFEYQIDKPSMDELIKRAKQRIQLKQAKTEPMEKKEAKVVRRTTTKPPELQFKSNPKPPPIRKVKRKKLKRKRTQKITPRTTVISTSMQTVSMVQTSIEQDIQSMASCTEEQDTVNILNHSQNSLNSFCDNVLNQLLTKSISSVDESQSTLNTEQIDAPSPHDVIQSIMNELITKASVAAEHNTIEDNHHMETINELEEEIQTIVHISSSIPKQSLTHLVEHKSPISMEKELHTQIKPIEVAISIPSYPVSSVMTSACTSCLTSRATSACTSAVSSVPTSMVSSLDASDMKRWCNMKVTDSVLSGISISGSDMSLDDSCESEESEDFDNLKESLNRQWNEIQFALNNLQLTH